MPQAFDAHNPPFDRLDSQEIEQLRAAHVIIKGSVEERDGEELDAVLGPKESFDARALVHGAAGAAFVAAEETLCYLAPKPLILDLIRRNDGFAAFFYSEISNKLASFTRIQ